MALPCMFTAVIVLSLLKIKKAGLPARDIRRQLGHLPRWEDS